MKNELTILLAEDNPTGKTVESLVGDMIHDLTIKNQRIDNNSTPFDEAIDKKIKKNNENIIASLIDILYLQENTMDVIKEWKEGKL